MSDEDPLKPLRRPTMRLLVGTLVLLVTSGVLHRWVYWSRAFAFESFRPMAAPLTDIPERLGSFWLQRDFELPPDVLRVAKVDGFVHREYADSESNLPIVLYVGYWGRPNVGLGHGPEICFPAAGWRKEGIPSERTIHFVEANGMQKKVIIAIHHFNLTEPEAIRRFAVGFVAVMGGEFQPSSRGKFLHAPPKNSNEAFVAHIQVGTSVAEDAWAQGDSRIIAFMEAALSPVSACLFGGAPVTSSSMGG